MTSVYTNSFSLYSGHLLTRGRTLKTLKRISTSRSSVWSHLEIEAEFSRIYVIYVNICRFRMHEYSLSVCLSLSLSSFFSLSLSISLSLSLFPWQSVLLSSSQFCDNTFCCLTPDLLTLLHVISTDPPRVHSFFWWTKMLSLSLSCHLISVLSLVFFNL
jgi:hypothetical protein